ncbi:MAG: hypothetical protein R6U65_08470 [Perlabentimonas sp.]
MRDPSQEILKAAVNFLNIVYDGETIPVTTTYQQQDFYIVVSVPSIPIDDGTNDGAIYDLTLRIEAVTEFLTDEQRDTVSNKIMEQITEQINKDSFNVYLTGFEVVLINFGSLDRETQQDNTSNIIIKRKDFTLKVAET